MKIYIGFEPHAAAAYWIQRASILRYHPDARVVPLVQQLLRMQGIYQRPIDPKAATEFTYTRFLVPHLQGYQGRALFMDGDMLVRGPLTDLFNSMDPYAAVGVVKHDHRPNERYKMLRDVDGSIETKVQEVYPRKNWSSLMLFNCMHPACRRLSPAFVNTAEPAILHRFNWVNDADIHEFDPRWNWLEGWNKEPNPSIVHFTRGIPGIHDGYSEVPYSEEYFNELDAMNLGEIG